MIKFPGYVNNGTTYQYELWILQVNTVFNLIGYVWIGLISISSVISIFSINKLIKRIREISSATGKYDTNHYKLAAHCLLLIV